MQLGTLELAPTRDVLLADGLHALRVQRQAFFGGASGELVQVEVRTKAFFSRQYLERNLVAVVPHEIDFTRQLTQTCTMLVFQVQAQGAGGVWTADI